MVLKVLVAVMLIPVVAYGLAIARSLRRIETYLNNFSDPDFLAAVEFFKKGRLSLLDKARETGQPLDDGELQNWTFAANDVFRYEKQRFTDYMGHD